MSKVNRSVGAEIVAPNLPVESCLVACFAAADRAQSPTKQSTAAVLPMEPWASRQLRFLGDLRLDVGRRKLAAT